MSLHHNYDEGPCQLCEVKLKTAHPFFKDLWPKLKKRFPLVHVSWAYRGAEEQAAMVKSGASSLVYPLSLHNKTDSNGAACSRAIDLFFYNEDGAAVWSYWQFMKTWEWMKAEKMPIEWGGLWKKPRVDGPHYQLKEEIKQP